MTLTDSTMTAPPPHHHPTVPSSPPPKEEESSSSHLPNKASTTNSNTTATTLLPLSSSSSFALLLPYILGLLWTASHPLISILTGELKCRGSYIDEHGLDVHRHRVAVYPTVRQHGSSSSSGSSHAAARDALLPIENDDLKEKEKKRLERSSSMCDTIRHFSFSSSTSTVYISPSIECYHHEATPQISFDIVRILPSIGPSIDSVESIVLVVGSSSSSSGGDDSNRNNDWYHQSDMNASLLHLISKLGNRNDAPWLSKAVLIVSPTMQHLSAPIAATMLNESNITTTGQQQHYGRNDSGASLTAVVDAFIASYFLDDNAATVGGRGGVRPLPPDFTFPMIRSLLVIHDDDDDDDGNQQDEAAIASSSMTKEMDRSTEVRILPHGIGGSLPNLDLVFATLLSFQSRPAGGGGGGTVDRSASIYYGNSEFAVYPRWNGIHTKATMKKMEKRMIAFLTRIVNVFGVRDGPIFVEQYVKDWMGLVGFVWGMAIGPRQPHASALHHGIDSLTIQVNIPNRKGKDTSSLSSLSIHPHYADLTRCLEHLIRSISNLHERLHHSVSQYLLPSPTKFVSHGEYIYPGVLISLPMVIRAATLALRDMKRFQVMFLGNVLGGVALASLVIGIYVMNSPQLFWDDAKYSLHGLMMNSIYLLSYALVIFVAIMARDRLQKCSSVRKVAKVEQSEHEECRKSLRFVVCLLGVYLHAPLLLANYSLGLSSAVFWSPLLGTFVLPPSTRAFLSKKKKISQLLKVVGGMFLVSTSPPILLVPRIFPFYTIYVIAVYTPLHLLLMVLWMM